MRATLFAALVGLVFGIVLATGPTTDRVLREIKLLEERIPGYSGMYYDREHNEYVVRIVPRLNPKLRKLLGRQMEALPLGRELRLPRTLARSYEQTIRSVRLGPPRSALPVRFEVGRYTWSEHLAWTKRLLRFRNNKESMRAYGYATWPEDCTIYYAGLRSVKKDVSYILIHETCDEAFISALFTALKKELGIPADALEIWRVPNWTGNPL